MTAPKSDMLDISEGFEDLDAFWRRLDTLETSIEEFSERAQSFLEEPIERVLERIRAFEPSVSVIGQVKAGKSTLLNAMIGTPGLLPSDVNPWTSVITAVHMNSRYRPHNTRALFRFFDAEEWDRLVATGGRLGEIAARAGFEAEAEEVRQQVEEMRSTTEARIGKRLTELLGGSHSFPEIDQDTIDRYICYGDPDEVENGATEGVYADITRLADLYIDAPNRPRGLAIRDTPGVNDTFMMREQITLNAISDSRVCVVVLSAHQALSTMDLALLRIITMVEAREVLIFVNRIDELADPLGEQKKIRASIEATLKRLDLLGEIEILFGSGYWANVAIDPSKSLVETSLAALKTLYPGLDTANPNAVRRAAWTASGLDRLHRAISRRVVEGPGAAFLHDVQCEIDSIIARGEAILSTAEGSNVQGPEGGITPDEVRQKADAVRQAAFEGFDAEIATIRADLRERLEAAQQSFVSHALSALQTHADMYGERGTWRHDPTTLRMTMKSAYVRSCAALSSQGEASLDEVTDGIQAILSDDLGVFRKGTAIEFPQQPQHQAPTILARTLSLDLGVPWWRRFWRFGRKAAAETRYRKLLVSETTPLIDDLIAGYFDTAVERTRTVIADYATDQANFVAAICECREPRDDGDTILSTQRLSA